MVSTLGCRTRGSHTHTHTYPLLVRISKVRSSGGRIRFARWTFRKLQRIWKAGIHAYLSARYIHARQESPQDIMSFSLHPLNGHTRGTGRHRGQDSPAAGPPPQAPKRTRLRTPGAPPRPRASARAWTYTPRLPAPQKDETYKRTDIQTYSSPCTPGFPCMTAEAKPLG